MKILTLVLPLLIFTSCAINIVDKKKIQFEDCIIKMRNADIAPLKALEICTTVHETNKDIID